MRARPALPLSEANSDRSKTAQHPWVLPRKSVKATASAVLPARPQNQQERRQPDGRAPVRLRAARRRASRAARRAASCGAGTPRSKTSNAANTSAPERAGTQATVTVNTQQPHPGPPLAPQAAARCVSRKRQRHVSHVGKTAACGAARRGGEVRCNATRRRRSSAAVCSPRDQLPALHLELERLVERSSVKMERGLPGPRGHALPWLLRSASNPQTVPDSPVRRPTEGPARRPGGTAWRLPRGAAAAPLAAYCAVAAAGARVSAPQKHCGTSCGPGDGGAGAHPSR